MAQVIAAKKHKCYLCGEISDKVNHFIHRHVGGDGGTTEFPICDDAEKCKTRMEQANQEWQQAMGIKGADEHLL